MKKATFILILMCCSMFLFSQSETKEQITEFIDSWHKAAADNDQEAYFNKIHERGIYIGTDSSELWTRQEFYDWSTPHFEKQNGWDFKAVRRNIYLNEQEDLAWFDEQLSFYNGILRGSGVLVNENNSWYILHYVLSVPVPNDRFKNVMKVIHDKPIVTDDKQQEK